MQCCDLHQNGIWLKIRFLAHLTELTTILVPFFVATIMSGRQFRLHYVRGPTDCGLASRVRMEKSVGKRHAFGAVAVAPPRPRSYVSGPRLVDATENCSSLHRNMTCYYHSRAGSRFYTS